jgi:hypothetical protein
VDLRMTPKVSGHRVDAIPVTYRSRQDNLLPPSQKLCQECGGGPVTITPHGLLCSEHVDEVMTSEEYWLPLWERADRRQRPPRVG